MTVYFLAYAAMIAVAALSVKSPKRKAIVCGFGFLLWILLLGLRHPTMGVDLQSGFDANGVYHPGYLESFTIHTHSLWQDVLTGKTNYHYEIGYRVFNKLVGTLSANPQVFLLACYIVIFGAASLLFYQNSKAPLLSFIIFLGLPFFTFCFSGLRQAIAVGVTMFSFLFIRDKKPLPFVLLVLLAATFHKSALIFLPAYPCFWIRTEKPVFMAASIVLLASVFLLREPLYAIAQIMFPFYKINYTGAYSFLLFLVAIYLAALVVQDKNNAMEIGYRNLFYISCLIQIAATISNNAMRMGYYYMVYAALLLPEIICGNRFQQEPDPASPLLQRLMTRRNAKLLYVLTLLFFLAIGLYFLASSGSGISNPYRFFWQNR